VPGRSFHVETLGCPKNQVDSDKLVGTLLADGMTPAPTAADADLVVVNTCAFVEEARQESIDVVLALSEARKSGARVVVTGCMAERYGSELASALPEVDAVAGFGVPVSIGRKAPPSFDLLNLPRPPASAPWAYVKVAEGCDRACGFCAIPSFRGPQRSRTVDSILAEVDELVVPRSGCPGVKEVVLVAQDLASFGRDQGEGTRRIVPLVRAIADRVARTRLLYLYPSDLTDALVDAVCDTGVPYFDLSLQHVSRPLLRRMRRWGDGARFLARIEAIRAREPDAAFRSNFIVGYPGETEDDHDALLRFVEDAQLDWCGFFTFSEETGTMAATQDRKVDPSLARERHVELTELQDRITARRRDAHVGTRVEVLVDVPGAGRTHREAPEIDGIVRIPHHLEPGTFATLTVQSAEGPDLEASLAPADEGAVATLPLSDGGLRRSSNTCHE
jgi:ribosomal protein S12 methylthiotransferase